MSGFAGCVPVTVRWCSAEMSVPSSHGQRGAGQRGSRAAASRPGGTGRLAPRRRGAEPARRAAYDVLIAVTSRDAYANLMLSARLAESRMTDQDAALTTELVYGTLRGLSCYDAIIGACADRDVDRIDLPVRNVLRIGTHQLVGMRTKPHAAVATSVDLAIDVAGRRPSGFVNAVLRRIAQRDLAGWLEIVAPARAADPVGYLAIRYSHPRWIVAAIADALGEDAADSGLAESEAALAANGERPVVTLAAIPGLATPAELAAAGAEGARWSPFGAYLPHGDPGRLAAIAQRRAGVQDEASQLAVLALSRVPVPGDEHAWLDLCAGPGGKARLLGGLAAERGLLLVAADLHEHRARLTGQALSRIRSTDSHRDHDGHRDHAGRQPGGDVARAVSADGLAPAWRPGSFDRVLADVPCTGLGSLRRRPEARWRRGPDDVETLHPLQLGLLRSALDAVRPGGVVAYVTCTPHLAETVGVIDDLLAGRQDVEVLDTPALLPEVPDLRCPAPHERYAQLWPHRHGTDAIFIALLRRTGNQS
jgi:16S rRNA (cytosine967-C5)-methyltransferase